LRTRLLPAFYPPANSGLSSERSPMAVTIQDVAQAAGVALSTVSRALADNPRVSLATRRRIQALAKEMGYTPSAIARGLATKRTRNLGVVVRDIADPFIAELVRNIDNVALEHGYTLLLSHCGGNPERELGAINLLRQQRVDAIIVADPSVGDSVLPTLEELQVPVLLINRRQCALAIGTDNVAAARLAVAHLADLGHRRIAYIGTARNRAESRERQAGYEQELRARGLTLQPELVVEGEGEWPESGHRSMQALLRLPQPPTAVFCFNDLTAIGAMASIHDAGLSVPADISVVGFDGISLGAHVNPALTSVAQDREGLARRAVEIVLDRLNAQNIAPPQLLPGKLVLRHSTRPLPR